MSKILAGYTKIFLVTYLFFFSFTSISQVLLEPQLGFGSACSNAQNKDFNFTFRYTTQSFDPNNVFTIELSDASGSFANAQNVGSVFSQNSNYGNIPATFQLPDSTFGTGYRVRIVASSPAMTGPASEAFAAYDMLSNLVLNNWEDVYICGTGTQEMSLNTDKTAVYNWIKDGVHYITTTEPRLNVSQEGLYKVEVDYGVCGLEVSTLSRVFIVNSSNSGIKGDSTVEICSDETHTFEAEQTDNSLTYNWYKDGNLVYSSNNNSYTTPNNGQFGAYHLVVSSGQCAGEASSEVVLQQKTTASFTLQNNIEGKNIMLPGETKALRVDISPPSATVQIQWYKDEQPLGGKNGNEMNATEPGAYFARVTELGGVCNFTQDSEIIELIGVQSINSTIRTSTDYEECNSHLTKLLIVGVDVTGTDGESYQLTDDQLDNSLNYQWYKDGAELTGQIQKELDVTSYVDNGSYELAMNVGFINDRSNTVEVKLTVADPTITSSSLSNSLCPGGTITYTLSEIVNGFTYTWYKDAEVITVSDSQTLEVSEVGEYRLDIEGAGCLKQLTPIKVVPFDDSAVVITPSEKVVIVLGETATVTASGANTYEWYDDETNDLLSTNETLEVNKLGFFTVVATVDDCEVRKTIEVVEQDDQVVVPNILSPNTVDGINDFWKLSNKYAFQPSVTVIIYNASGQEVYKTTDYKNDWPSENLGNQRNFYFKIIRNEQLVKAGSISILD